MHTYIYEVNYTVSHQNVLQWVCRVNYALVPSTITITHHTVSVKKVSCTSTKIRQSARNLLQRVPTSAAAAYVIPTWEGVVGIPIMDQPMSGSFNCNNTINNITFFVMLGSHHPLSRIYLEISLLLITFFLHFRGGGRGDGESESMERNT